MNISTILELGNGHYTNDAITIIYKKIALISYWAILCSLGVSIISELPQKKITSAIKITILIMSTYLLMQMISYHFLDYSLDFSLLTGGINSRSYFGTYRPSGFLPEPSVYSGHMIALLALYFTYNKKIDIPVIIGIASILLSQSTAGIILALLMIVCILSQYFLSKKNSILILASLIVTMYFIYPKLLDRYHLLLSGADTSNNLKITGLQHFYYNDTFFTGFGVIARDHSSLPDYYEAIKDYTLFGNILTIYGIPIGTIILILLSYLIIRSKLSISNKIILSLPFIKLCSPNYSFFFIYFGIYIILLSSKKNKTI
ncbi:hypothetical protein [Morganella morganii]|uniref:hypothetical protein n=1 Tax=Morganella morganii TaxID=582 RepID=UPI0034E5B766